MNIFAFYPDMEGRTFFPAKITLDEGRIQSIERINSDDVDCSKWTYMLPGLVDAHVHIESSMLTPAGFANLSVRHGTVAVVSDPHEIANVLGAEGIDFMIRDAARVPLKIYYTLPSCVPATTFESSGAEMNADDLERIIGKSEIVALGEMMNFPGVVYDDVEVHRKLVVALKHNKPVDGHAPGLSGRQLRKYVEAGITTDHEAVSLKEAIEKMTLGMKILIREGSAAKNFEALHSLISTHTDQVMLCADDIHPDDLLLGHVDQMVRMALTKGHSIFDIIKVACVNPITHYKLNVGQLKPGDPADFILIDHPDSFQVQETWINGVPVYREGAVLFTSSSVEAPNQFITQELMAADFKVVGARSECRVIEAIDGSLLTNALLEKLSQKDGYLISDPSRDILKLTVVNRYQQAPPAIGFIKNFGLKHGAIASSVAHDSHNIIAVGCSDEDIANAVNALIQHKGGIAVHDGNQTEVLPLPVGGIMSNEPGHIVAQRYAKLSHLAQEMGSQLKAPFMTLSFMALLVIPELKLGDRGLFDVHTFNFVSLTVDS